MKFWISAGFFTLFVSLLPSTTITKALRLEGAFPFGPPIGFILILVLSLSLIVVALVLLVGLNLSNAGRTPGTTDRTGRERLGLRIWAVVSFLLASALLVSSLRQIFWLMVWDTTYDPLGFLWLVFPFLAAGISGVILLVKSPVKPSQIGFGYSLGIALLAILVSISAQQVDFRILTERRAERVSLALESYYTRIGQYPRTLAELIPNDVLSLPQPVVIFGQYWCYETDGELYRLGYVTRDHWSDPRLFGKISRVRGEVSTAPPICGDEIAMIQSMYPEYPFTYRADGD